MTWDAEKSRRFKHIFLDAEGTLYVPRGGRTTWEFWANPSPERAKDFFVLDEGVSGALKTLRGKVESMCIVSKNSKPILDVLLADFGIRQYFDDVIVNGNKGEQIVEFLNKRGHDRRDAVMVGDTPTLDLYPVRKAGVEAILVDRPYNRMADAERIKGVRELPFWLMIADMAEEAGRARNTTLDDFLEPEKKDTGRLISVPGC
jgi:predicted HAD superfamily phosphohydrolase YqeG